MSEEKRIRITPKPAVELRKPRVGRPRTKPIVNPEDKRPVGRPRTRPIGPGKALGEKRPMTKNRRNHMEKMRVALRASRARKKAEKEATKTRADNVRSDGSHLTVSKAIEPEHVGNPQRSDLHLNMPPAPKPDYNTPILAGEADEGKLTRGLENDHWHSSYDVDHHTFYFGSHPTGVSHPGGSLGASMPPSGQGHHEPSATRGSGTGNITHPSDSGSFFL